MIAMISFYNYRKTKLGINWFKIENHVYTGYYQGHYYHQISEKDIPADLLSGGWNYTWDVLLMDNSTLGYFTPDFVKPHIDVLSNETEQDNIVYLRTNTGRVFRYFQKEDWRVCSK